MGRVQTPTLGLVVTRDKEAQEFVASPYFELRASLALKEDRTITGRWIPGDACSDMLDYKRRLTDKGAVYSLTKTLEGCDGEITSAEKKSHSIAPPLPFSLSKLQMAASRKYDITDTLVHVQKLYESAYVSYPRTSCEYIPEVHFIEAPLIIDAIRAGCPVLADMIDCVDLNKKNTAWNTSKIQEHYAIIPTTRAPLENVLSDTERKIYELICSRYVLQFLADYEYEETIVEFKANKETFRTAGRTVINLGWQGWDKQNDGEDNGKDEEANSTELLPAVHKGETGTIQPSVTEKMTKPPKPYTYHSLLAAMNGIHAYAKDPNIRAKLKEVQGIGTEATQESVLGVLFKRGYMEKKKKQVISTALGRLLIDILSKGKASVMVHPDMTALWEQEMTSIEQGSASLEPFVSEVADMVRVIISDRLDVPSDLPEIPGMTKHKARAENVIETPCPLHCGNNARRYEGKYGHYWRCVCSPNITFKDIDGKPVVKEQRVEAKCPTKGCKGKTTRFASKKDGRLFWKCAVCGNFFDDIGGKPIMREKEGQS
ncbi:hypothetical protein AGMMS49957_17280 [Synergistales bacterium]|nr:hypothetical protein AGMMS49957_17280 [Synergistales bacterium]